jgi:uncharacterized membrane protein YcaP (DUF421 family)
MNIQADDMGYPVIVINDGHVIAHNLKKLGFNLQWLEKQLISRKLKNADDVFLMTADASGKVYLAFKEGE